MSSAFALCCCFPCITLMALLHTAYMRTDIPPCIRPVQFTSCSGGVCPEDMLKCCRLQQHRDLPGGEQGCGASHWCSAEALGFTTNSCTVG